MHRYCRLIIISVALLIACSDQTSNQVVECESSLASCTFQEIIHSILRRQPSTPLETEPFIIDFIKERYGVEEIDCSHTLLSDHSEFVRMAELSLEESGTETDWECKSGESFTEYKKGTPKRTSEFEVIDQTAKYGIVEGTVIDPEMLKQLEVLWESCEVGTEPPNFTGVFRSSIGFLPLEDQKFCVTLDVLPGAKQCFAKTTPPDAIEYSSHNGEISRESIQVSESDYCRLKENTDSQAQRVKIF